MPELPEVERAAALVREIGTGKRIDRVETVQDDIVFSGISHNEFAHEITGRTIQGARRYGKVFYVQLDGEGRLPVLHFGMTGMLQVKGQLATYYKETPRSASTQWPPRFMKFILHLHDPVSGETTHLAFLDARRLGRIRLCASPLEEPPICDLGYDPIISMPPLAEFQAKLLKRTCPIKALLLDQSFTAGVGNWVADEILYHARVHPEQRCNTLLEEQIAAIHHHTAEVCKLAVAVNADDTKFPEDWLMRHRWGKGKKKAHTLNLPSGGLATIKWVTVGGRTSAYVEELQTLRNPGIRVKDAEEGSESDLPDLTDSDLEDPQSVQQAKRKRQPPRRTSRHFKNQETSKPDPGSKKRARQS